MFTDTRPKGGVWAKDLKPSVHSSVLGVPYETVAWGDDGRWWVQVDNMEVVGGLHVCQCKARGGV